MDRQQSCSMAGNCSVPRIEVVGSIGCGKTTLVGILSSQFMKGIYEDHTINPFWESFYTDPSTCAFETEISFLLQHYHFAKLAAASTGGVILLDHSFELDMAYAEVGLEGSRKDIFASIYREIRNEIGLPRALVSITCSAGEALRRIRERGRSFEESITVEFLADLQRELGRRIVTIADSVPVVTIDSEATDFRDNGSWRESLIDQLHPLIDGVGDA